MKKVLQILHTSPTLAHVRLSHNFQFMILNHFADFFQNTQTPWLRQIRITNTTFQKIPIPHLAHTMKQKFHN